MRLAFDARPLNHPFTGIGVYTRRLVERLAERHDLFGYLDRPLTGQPIDGVTFRSLRSPAWLRPLVVHLVFPTWARRDGAEVFWSPRHHLPLALTSLPTVVTVHDLVWQVAPETMRPLNRWLEALLMPIALNRATEVIAVSRDTAGRIASLRDRPASVVYEAANTAPGATPYAHERPYFLFVGTREPRKNLNRLIEAFETTTINADLILVGGTGWGETRSPRRLATGRARVIDLGAVDDATVASLYAGCLAVVLPSIYEGFGLPLVEGLSYGKPLITSDRGSMPEIAGDAAVYVDPLDPSTIRDAIESVARDQDLAGRLASAAMARRGQFCWDLAAAQTGELIERAARRKPSRRSRA